MVIRVNKKTLIIAVALIQIIVCIAVFSYYKDEMTIYNLDSNDMVSDSILIQNFMESQESGYYIDSSDEAKERFVVTSPVDLKFGMYKVIIHYQSEEPSNTYTLTANDANFRDYLGNCANELPADKKIYTANAWFSKNMTNFQVEFDYNGEGYFFVSRVDIIENRNWVIGLGILLLIIFMCMDCAYFLRDSIKKKVAKAEWKNQALILVLITFFTSLPLFSPYMFHGHDLYFHLIRIEGIVDGIRSGQFPVRLQPNWMNGYGYGVSFFYGDALLYFPAVLRMLGMGVQTAYKCFLLFINILSVGIAYYSFKRIFHDEKMGLLGCMLYTTSIYRMVCIYSRAALGEYCALTFLPLILVIVYEILWQDDQEENPQNSWLIGAIGLSGLILTHIVSTEIIAVMVVIICLIYWKKTFRKNAILQFLKMGLGALVATLWFVVPFIDMLIGNFYWFKASTNYIQTQGTFLGQLFNIFPYAEGKALSHSVIDGVALGNELCYSIGGGLIAGALLFMIYSINYGKNKSRLIFFGKRLLITGGILTIMTTVYFPWDDLQNLGGIFAFIIKNLQFPWRLLGLITLCFTALALITVSAFAKEGKAKGIFVCSIILIFAIISSGYFEGRLINYNNTLILQNADDIDTGEVMGGEYLPYIPVLKWNRDAEHTISSKGVQLESVEREYQKFNIICSNLAKEEGYIDLPLLYYDGYVAEAAGLNEKLTVTKNNTGCLRIMLPEDFAGEIVVNYISRWYWRLAEIISVMGVAGFIVYKLIIRIKHKRIKKN